MEAHGPSFPRSDFAQVMARFGRWAGREKEVRRAFLDADVDGSGRVNGRSWERAPGLRHLLRRAGGHHHHSGSTREETDASPSRRSSRRSAPPSPVIRRKLPSSRHSSPTTIEKKRETVVRASFVQPFESIHAPRAYLSTALALVALVARRHGVRDRSDHDAAARRRAACSLRPARPPPRDHPRRSVTHAPARRGAPPLLIPATPEPAVYPTSTAAGRGRRRAPRRRRGRHGHGDVLAVFARPVPPRLLGR